MHVCILRFFAQERKKVRKKLITSYSCYLTISFPSFEFSGLRVYGTVLSLHEYALLFICRSFPGMQWFSHAVT